MKQHENKTEWESPTIEQPWFKPITDDEAAEIRGGQWGAGTCVGVGYACNSNGKIRLGLCAIIGVF